MQILPVAERELRVASRRKGTYWTRAGAATVAFLLLAVLLLATTRSSPQERGQILFCLLSVLAFGTAVLTGISAADAVSEETRDGTLGLLFLTDLRGYDVILGKLISKSLVTVTWLMALAPVLTIPLLIGGVPGTVVFHLMVLLGVTTFLSLCLGLLVSVLTRDPWRSISAAFSAVFALLFGPHILRWFVRDYLGLQTGLLDSALSALTLVSPIGVLEQLFRMFTRIGPFPAEFWTSMAVQHLLSWGCLAAACLLLPRTWRSGIQAARSTTPSVRRGPWAKVRTWFGRGSQRPVGDTDPYSWLLRRDRSTERAIWFGFAVMGLLWLWGFVESGDSWLNHGVALTMGFAGAVWLKLRCAALSTRHFHVQRENGAFELLLCAPNQPEALVRGAFQGLRATLLAPTLTLVGVTVLLGALASMPPRVAPIETELVSMFVVGLLIFLLDLLTLARVGTWLGLRFKRPLRAYSTTIFLVMVVPWAAFVVSMIFFGTAFSSGVSANLGFSAVVIWWGILGVAVDVLLLVIASAGLTTELDNVRGGAFPSLPPAPGVAQTDRPPAQPVTHGSTSP